jgi:hypothetical protein
LKVLEAGRTRRLSKSVEAPAVWSLSRSEHQTNTFSAAASTTGKWVAY